jgi:hypothetical protein
MVGLPDDDCFARLSGDGHGRSADAPRRQATADDLRAAIDWAEKKTRAPARR